MGKLNTRVLWFFARNRRIIAVHGVRNKGWAIAARDLRLARERDASLAQESGMMKKTNFDRYLEEQLRDPAFSARFERAGEAWDVALQIAALRQQAGLSQKDLAKLLKPRSSRSAALSLRATKATRLACCAASPRRCMRGFASYSNRRRLETKSE